VGERAHHLDGHVVDAVWWREEDKGLILLLGDSYR
jgi:hypothetical protein